jgi:hypothetical protein
MRGIRKESNTRPGKKGLLKAQNDHLVPLSNAEWGVIEHVHSMAQNKRLGETVRLSSITIQHLSSALRKRGIY